APVTDRRLNGRCLPDGVEEGRTVNQTAKEQQFLQAWMHDELHFRQGTGPAKRLQPVHEVKPADLAVLIAAWLPDPNEQFRRAEEPLPDTLEWPWQRHEEFEARLHQAKAELALRNRLRARTGQ